MFGAPITALIRVDVHIRRLRKAISGAGHEEFIQTVRGAGYRFSGKLTNKVNK